MTTTASTPSAEKIHQIQATTTPEGEVKFALPIKPELVESVEAIDLDLMLTTTSGEKYILQQGALLATTNSESKLVFSNGDAMSATDQMKRMGVMKPVEGGSFRLASALTPEAAEKVTGNEFGLGKDAQDTVAKIEKIIQSLESATQSSQNSESNSAQGLGKNSAFKSNADPLASPAAGAPPKPDTSTTDANVGIKTVSLLAHDYQGVEYNGKAIGKTEIQQLAGKSTVELVMTGSTSELIIPADKIQNQLILSGVPKTTQITLTFNEKQIGFAIPKELRINDQLVKAGEPLTLNVNDMTNNEVPLDLTWSEGDLAAKSNFEVSVSYTGSTGEKFWKTISFTGDIQKAYTLDANGAPRLYISNKTGDLLVTANDSDNTITTGSGNDTILGSPGADNINGGGGVINTVNFAQSTSAISIKFDTEPTNQTDQTIKEKNTGLGGLAEGDQLTNIQKIIGSTHDDNFTFSANTPYGYTIDGDAGSDQLNYSAAKAASALTINLTAAGSGSVSGSDYGTTKFTSIEQFNTGTGDDTFTFVDADITTYKVNGGSGTDVLDYSNVSKDLTISLAASAASAVQGTAPSEYGKTTFGGIEQITTGSGNDTFNLASSDAASITINSGSGDDTFKLGTNDKTHYTIDGGSNTGTTQAIDTLNYTDSGTALTATLNTTGTGSVTSTNVGDYGTTTFSNIEKIITGSSADTFTFAAANKNNYTIDGGSGAVGSPQPVDVLNYTDSGTALTATLNASGTSTVTGSALDTYGTTTFSNIEKIITGSGDDTITIDSADTTAYTIDGGGGNDTINGGNSHASTLSYASSDSSVQLAIANAAGTSTGGGGSDNFSNFTKFLGSSANDTFTLTNGDTTQYTLNGGGGSDTFKVVNGSKASIDGGALADNDTMDYANVTSKVTLNVNAGVGGSNDQASGSNNITFSNIKTFIGGTGGSDFTANVNDLTAYTFKGGSGNDTLNGGSGNDTLDFHTNNINLTSVTANGGAGDDTVIINQDKLGSTTTNLDGGSGTDTLVVYKGTSTAALDLKSLKATNFEILDVFTDTNATSVTLSSDGIQSLVNGSNSSILTLKLGANDSYTIATEENIIATQGKSGVTFYSTGTDHTQLAQVIFV